MTLLNRLVHFQVPDAAVFGMTYMSRLCWWIFLPVQQFQAYATIGWYNQDENNHARKRRLYEDRYWHNQGVVQDIGSVSEVWLDL